MAMTTAVFFSVFGSVPVVRGGEVTVNVSPAKAAEFARVWKTLGLPNGRTTGFFFFGDEENASVKAPLRVWGVFGALDLDTACAQVWASWEQFRDRIDVFTVYFGLCRLRKSLNPPVEED